MDKDNLYNNLIFTNLFYLEKLYKKFVLDKTSVNKSWRSFFQKNFMKNNSSIINKQHHHDIMYVILQCIKNFRTIGHYYANNNPLNFNKNKIHDVLKIENLTLNNNILNKKIFVNTKLGLKSIVEIYDIYKNIYCENYGIEYIGLPNNEKKWLQKKIEFTKKEFSYQEKKTFLEELIVAEYFEKFIGNKFPGTKRFSLEGCDVLIPILKEIIRYISQEQAKKINIILGMAHRGRLNVLVNIMGKKIQTIIDEFNNININTQQMDDVKYHLGYSTIAQINNKHIYLNLVCNPSHLECINPVIMGIARAQYDKICNHEIILPINIHGDAAITGQGIVQETLNMSQTNGYNINGTIHIIINNQIGFTNSNIKDLRSSHYCTDIAKMINAPIFHVNADNVEDVIFILRIAIDYRNKYHKDVFIDLISYRRYGHSEIDDPDITQPIMYNFIKKHSTIQKIYQNKLLLEKIVNKKFIENIYDKCKKIFEKKCISTNHTLNVIKDHNTHDKKSFIQKPIQILKKLLYTISTIPNNFHIHKRVKKIYLDRIAMSQEKIPLDWGTAENLAYANILFQGISCRLSGEDITRGTFAHRHTVLYDQTTGIPYIPLKYINKKQGIFNIYNSVLSEESVLGFEYGYSIQNNNSLNIWEAQFGDFANGAQIIIDQFISSGEKKWGYQSNLIILLPHGYEGQGPEHSSARIERYLQLCAENNMKICVPTLAGQMYYLLCQQVLQVKKKPLIIMTPKSLLRNNLTFTPLKNLTNLHFFKIIDEIQNIDINNIKRIIFCMGKIYYDLLEYRNIVKNNCTVLIRIEQLYPFPLEMIKQIINKYTNNKIIFWCQEEPKNQGAWMYIQYIFLNKLKKIIYYIGREESSSTATGYINIHKKQQQNILFKAFNI
ncbi:2-oxoglutarate dehydrogenase E1 component [Enterobacteriaceae endosymbiont of Neohaemonia nigricornis]|uniref:2-oxoglutarate dehydrogenase E1 component n=1 Tax=Enterobacteriaceae endosymbiont of Neohaemonia nigricornis TaxID=2675792 RepID=UPI0014495200|nr:2-oxoglutarate dehydrogenase E1 component [Enterobacteriaceae endosymbiont of Neohaemonia nigricornis]QJC30394.1 2-oxoglutarate dehydrogenase E1 component [Enterobacteriaceae endosymbiont of Neohaemonia nigricornis]